MLADPPIHGRALLLAYSAGRNSEQCLVHPICLCVHVHIYVCMCSYMYVHICMCVSLSLYIYVSIFMDIESLSVHTFPSLPAPHGTESSCGRLDESPWHGLLQRCSPGCAELRADAGRDLHLQHRHLGACLAQEQWD